MRSGQYQVRYWIRSVPRIQIDSLMEQPAREYPSPPGAESKGHIPASTCQPSFTSFTSISLQLYSVWCHFDCISIFTAATENKRSSWCHLEKHCYHRLSCPDNLQSDIFIHAWQLQAFSYSGTCRWDDRLSCLQSDDLTYQIKDICCIIAVIMFFFCCCLNNSSGSNHNMQCE